MKPFILTILVLLVLPVFSGVGPDKPEKSPALFELNEQEVDDAFAELDALDRYLQENPGVTLADMQAEGHELVEEVDQINGIGVDNALDDDGGLSAVVWVLIVLGGLALIGVCCLVIASLGYY